MFAPGQSSGGVIKDFQSLKEGQKTIQEQTQKYLDQLKGLKDQQALLEKKMEAQEGNRPKAKAIVYKIKKGDTLRSVAKKFQVSPEDIRRWNRLPGKKLPAPGQKITLHSPSDP
jgi:LysM repeat protein